MYGIVAVLMRSRVQFSMLQIFFILYNNNNSGKQGPLYSEIPTGLLLDLGIRNYLWFGIIPVGIY